MPPATNSSHHFSQKPSSKSPPSLAPSKDALVAWLGSAENGIGQFFADVGNFHKISVSDSTGTSCYTRSQLDAVVAAAGAATAPFGENAGAPAAPPASAARHA